MATVAWGGEVKFPSPLFHPGRVFVTRPHEDTMCSTLSVACKQVSLSCPERYLCKS